MSIVGVIATAIATAAASNSIAILALPILVFTAVSISLAMRTRVFSLQLISGNDRLPGPARLGGLGLILLLGFCTWVLAQAIYANVIIAQWHAAGHTGTPPDFEAILTPKQLALMSVMPSLLAFVVILAFDRMMSPDLFRSLGVSPRFIGRGVLVGTLGLFIVYPWIHWTSFVAEQIYQYLQFAHPHEHPLLKSLGETTDRKSQIMILVSATVAAPLFEELLFRGHLQTFLRQGLLVMNGMLMAGMGAQETLSPSLGTPGEGRGEGSAPGDSDLSLVSVTPNPHPNPLPEYRAREKTADPLPAWPSWAAVIITSVLFTAVHPSWSYPPIFVLSLGLGYVYERTANLWAPIVLHLLFNSLQTLQFVLMMHGS